MDCSLIWGWSFSSKLTGSWQNSVPRGCKTDLHVLSAIRQGSLSATRGHSQVWATWPLQSKHGALLLYDQQEENVYWCFLSLLWTPLIRSFSHPVISLLINSKWTKGLDYIYKAPFCNANVSYLIHGCRVKSSYFQVWPHSKGGDYAELLHQGPRSWEPF